MSSGGSRGSSFAVRTRGRRDRSPLAGSTTFDGKSVPRTTASADGQWRRVLRYPAIFLVLRVALRSGGNKMRSLQFHSQAVRSMGQVPRSDSMEHKAPQAGASFLQRLIAACGPLFGTQGP